MVSLRTSVLVGGSALALALSACSGGQPSPSSSTPSPSTAASSPAISPAAETEHVRLRFEAANYDGWLDDIPASLDLSSGLPDPEGPLRRDHRPLVASFCGRDAFPRTDIVDQLAARVTGLGRPRGRDLRIFVDDRAAARFQGRALKAAASCAHTEVIPSRPAGSAFELRRSGLAHGHAGRWQVIREGSAVLIAATMSSRERRAVRDLAQQLCVFSAEGCPVADPDIPDGFPLTAGYPDNDQAEGPGSGLAGPSRALPAPTWELCGRELPPPSTRDRMAAQWSNPEDYRARNLYTFGDADEAVAFVGRLSDFWRSCPHEPSGTDFVAFQTVVPTSIGGQSVALVRSQEYQGEPGLGIVIEHVVRVGRAVLVDETSNEGWLPSLDDYLDSMTDSSAPVVDAMCAFTEAGC